MLPGRETQDWFLERLGKGLYELAHMHPNEYRIRSIEMIMNSNRNIYESIVRIERGSYIAGTGPY
jgi:hypothetical protein